VVRTRFVLLAMLAPALAADPSRAGVNGDLLLTKTAVGSEAASPPAPAGALIPGTAVTFTNTGENLGPGNVINATIGDPLPIQVVFLSAIATPGASLTTPAVGTNGMVTAVWDAAGGTPSGVTPVDTPRVVAIGARICPEAGCVTMTNTATMSGTAGNPDMATTETPLFPAADLSIAKTASAALVSPGDTLTYVLQVANAGPSTSPTTEVVDTLPAGFVATNVQTAIPGAMCSIAPGGQTVTCTFGLGANDQCAMAPLPTSGTINIDVSVGAGVSGGSKANSATIALTGDCGYDPNPDNNTAAAAVTVRGPAAAPALSPLALALLVGVLVLCAGVAMRRRRAA
jgi:uncharacterized repeat protein (TIGR01451 family)